jgi:ABC-type multidrug transport system fused ATPase/permease subunit
LFIFFRPDQLRKEANFWAGMFAILALVSFFCNFFQLAFFMISAEKLTRRLRSLTFDALMKQEIAYFDDEKNGTGILTSKLAVDATKVEGLTGQLYEFILLYLFYILLSNTIHCKFFRFFDGEYTSKCGKHRDWSCKLNFKLLFQKLFLLKEINHLYIFSFK